MRHLVLLLSLCLLSLPALAEEKPHPCTTNPELESCVELARELAGLEDAQASPSSLKEALLANAPAISERLNNAMLKVGEWVEATESFAADQAPLLVQEIVWWGVAGSGYWVGLGLFFITLGSGYGIFSYRRWEHLRAMTGDSGEFARFMAFAVPIVANFIGILMIMINIMSTLKPLVAPRLYLIEYFRNLVS